MEDNEVLIEVQVTYPEGYVKRSVRFSIDQWETMPSPLREMEILSAASQVAYQLEEN